MKKKAALVIEMNCHEVWKWNKFGGGEGNIEMMEEKEATGTIGRRRNFGGCCCCRCRCHCHNLVVGTEKLADGNNPASSDSLSCELTSCHWVSAAINDKVNQVNDGGTPGNTEWAIAIHQRRLDDHCGPASLSFSLSFSLVHNHNNNKRGLVAPRRCIADRRGG